ncbi:nicotinate-nucleotide adenylyltransferase [Limisalsivibrio acetivorans]|uniref:nicotinate-nucleotide adenylyltransferase n=1 Tax=Limisalsivibrio acetivorans TaxID=1304888 RepID=UPI0003B3F00A|nr:nicotinate-nucleotide adenylyltransferase [Limisalsivibrio acetivorans]
MIKLGLFGGTFNPIHIGHVALAQNVQRAFDLDKLLLIPSRIPPHKKTCDIAPETRMEMVQLVADKLGEEFGVSDYEVNSEEVSYSYKTVSKYRDEYPDAQIFFIAGTDIFASISTWQSYMELFELANFIVVNRSFMPFEKMLESIPAELMDRVVKADSYQGEKSGKVILYTMPEVDVSSTEIRTLLDEKYRKANLPEGVYEYISSNNLYGSGNDC